MKRKFGLLMVSVFCLMAGLTAVPVRAGDPPASTVPPGGGAQGRSLDELNKELSNPVTSIWSIAFQQNNYLLEIKGEKDRWNSNLNFQPVLPVALTGNWNLITRPVVTLINSAPHPDPNNPGEIERTTGFGDTVFMEMLAPGPKLVGKWLFGIGPTFIFPTASSDFTGQGKWQAGPAAVVGYLSKKWIVAAFVQNWTSFAGDSSRPDVNQMNFQPVAVYLLPDGCSVGYSGNILANWEAESAGDKWTVPIGIGIGKLLKLGPLPVKLSLGVQCMVHHPDDFGQQWNIQLSVIPVIPNLIKGALFD